MNNDIIRKLARAIQQENSGVWTREGLGPLYLHSHNFYRRFGLRSDRVKEKEWLDLIHPDDREYLKSCIADHITKRYEVVKTFYRVKEPNGHYVMFESTGLLYKKDGKDFFIGHHKVLDGQTIDSHRDPLTGFKNVDALTLDLKLSNNQDAFYYLISSDKVAHRSRLLGKSVTLELADLVENATCSLDLHNSEIYCLTQSHFVIKAIGSQCKDKSQGIIESIVNNCKHSEYISRDELTLVLIPEMFIKESNDVESFAINLSNYVSENTPGKFLILDFDSKNKILRRNHIQKALKEAINTKVFKIAIQPIVKSNSLSQYSTEVLARWNHEILGEIRPDEFIPLIEQMGYTAEFGWLIFEKSCRYLAISHTKKININASVKFLKSYNFIENIVYFLDKYNLKSNQFYLEITESFPLDDEPELIIRLELLKMMGFNLSLDDFGTGYTSLLAAFNLPLSQIKIDKKLISSIQQSKNFVYLIEFLRKLTKERNISLVAEGIETKEHIHVTRQLGIELLQGYQIAKPQTVNV